MKIFKLLSTTLAVLCFSSDLLSDITFYGKINTSYESTDKNSKTDTDFKNNASRLGVKGKFDINDGLKISFQIDRIFLNFHLNQICLLDQALRHYF